MTSLNDTVEQFELLFPTVADQKQTLQPYAGKITESNYIEKVEYLLSNSSQFSTSVQTILKAQKFIKKNFSNVKDFKRFIEEVLSELKKADRPDSSIEEASVEFMRLYKQDMVKNLGGLQQQVQVVKDGYYKLIKNAADGMSHAYQLLDGKVDVAIRNLKQNYPADLNTQNQRKLDELKRYCTDRIKLEVTLEYSIRSKISGYSLSDILNYTALAPTKENELIIVQSGFITETPTPASEAGGPNARQATKTLRKVRLQGLNKIMTVHEYKSILTAQLTSLAAASPDEEIELDIETV